MSTSVPAPDSSDGSGRLNQKRRTRQALIEAALRLTQAGRQPGMQEIADEAMVSRATAYRYYVSAEALVHDSQFARAVPAIDTLLAGLEEDPLASIEAVANAVNRLLLQDENGLHAIARSSAQVWLDNPPDKRPARPGRRMPMIDAVLERLAGPLPDPQRLQVRGALGLVMGADAMIAARDVCGLDPEQAVTIAAWAARTLLAAAIAESAAAPAAGAAGRRSGVLRRRS